MKPPPDDVAAELAGVEESLVEAVGGNGGIGTDVEPPMIVVAVPTDVVICPPGRVVVNVTGDVVVTLTEENAVGVTLSKLVETNVTVTVCPPGRILVTVVSTPEFMSDITLDRLAGDAAPGGIAELLISVVSSSGRVVVGATELLEGRGRLEPGKETGGGPPLKIIDVLVGIVVSPSDPKLVITRTVLDTVAELPVVASPGMEGVVAMEVLVNKPDDSVMSDGKLGVPPICEDVGSTAVLEIAPVAEGAKVGLRGVVEVTGGVYGPEGCAIGVLAPEETPDDATGELGEIGGKGTVEGSKVTVDIKTTFPEVRVLVNVIPTPGGSDIDSAGAVGPVDIVAPDPADPREDGNEASGARREVRVAKELDRLGGAMLLSHSVVPLITE